MQDISLQEESRATEQAKPIESEGDSPQGSNEHRTPERSNDPNAEDDQMKWSNLRTPPPSSRDHPFLINITWAPKRLKVYRKKGETPELIT